MFYLQYLLGNWHTKCAILNSWQFLRHIDEKNVKIMCNQNLMIFRVTFIGVFDKVQNKFSNTQICSCNMIIQYRNILFRKHDNINVCLCTIENSKTDNFLLSWNHFVIYFIQFLDEVVYICIHVLRSSWSIRN